MRILKSNFAIILIGLFTALCMMGCAKAPKDSDLQPWLNQFIADGSAYGLQFNTDKLTVQFGDLTHPIAGECSMDGDGNGVVTIDKTYWDEMESDEYKQIVTYHELGHCLLFRGHVANYTSIMNAYIISDETFYDNKSELLTELFTGQHTNINTSGALMRIMPFTKMDGRPEL